MAAHSIYLAICLAVQLLATWTNLAHSAVVVCYYGSWATYRYGNGKFDTSDLDPFKCTHVIYSFAGLDAATHKIKSLDTFLDFPEGGGKNNYAAFIGLKSINPALKTLLAIGGWNEGSEKFSNMVSTAANRKTFVDSVVAYLQKYGFDGLDFDWEFPADRGGVVADKLNYVQVLKDLRTEFNKYGYILTVAFGAGKSIIDRSYDVAGISAQAHYIHVMNYDYHGSWEATTGHVAPLYARPDESYDNQFLNVNYTIHYLISLGAPVNKLVMGMPLYGVSFTLANPSNNGLYAPATGPGQNGPYTLESGFIGYNELCEKMKGGGWTVVRDPIQKVPRAFSGNQWVGFDDVDSVTEKCNFAKSLNLAGGMVWSIETDDFRGICGAKYPLLTAINQALNSGATPATTTTAAAATTTTTSAPTTTKAATTKAATTSAASTTAAATTAASTAASTTAGSVGDTQAYVLSRCPEGKDIRDPNDCSTFYQCVSNGSGGYIIYANHCSAGLGYDESIQACNWKAQVPGC